MTSAPSSRAVARATLVVAGVIFGLYLIYLLRRPITWIVIAAFIAIAVSGPIDGLQRRIGRRGASVALVYLLLVLIPLGILGMIGGTIVGQGSDLVAEAPRYAQEATAFVERNPTLRGFEEDFDLTGKLQEQAQELPGRIGSAAGTLSKIGVGIVNSVFAIVTILILSVFLVGSGRRWVEAAIGTRPPRQAERLQRTVDRIGQAVGAYVGGALAQAVIAGVTSYVVMLVLGVPFAAPLAVLIALFDLIPLVGATIGAVVVGIVTLFTNFPVATIVWVIWSVVYQQVENTVIQPQIQKRAVDLHPFVVLVAVLFGSTLFGVLGALLAIPLAAAIQIVVREFLRLRRYDAEPAVPPAPPARAAT